MTGPWVGEANAPSTTLAFMSNWKTPIMSGTKRVCTRKTRSRPRRSRSLVAMPIVPDRRCRVDGCRVPTKAEPAVTRPSRVRACAAHRPAARTKAVAHTAPASTGAVHPALQATTGQDDGSQSRASPAIIPTASVWRMSHGLTLPANQTMSRTMLNSAQTACTFLITPGERCRRIQHSPASRTAAMRIA